MTRMENKKIILASQSPRRKQLLEWAEIPFEVVVSDADESYPEGLTMEEVSIYIAKNKARAVQQSLQQKEDLVIIAADTIVVLENEVIGKPADRNDAIAILKKLSGTKHEVLTGVVILAGEKEIAFADSTQVEFHSLTEEQIAFYTDKYQPYDKAGAYAIQEWIGVVGIKSINGDFYNVMGLPISRVVQQLQML
ncbi:MAG TPA: Maf family nucleotide pyrophosphatase [Ferruginibacter sp.]|nr:Maf family nucleotide pyrophosphatase [Ferruginibacter sp.]